MANTKYPGGQAKCPICDSDWDGGLILDSFKKSRDEGVGYYADMTDEQLAKKVKENYGSEDAHWSNIIGIEILGQYDGVSFWECPECKTQWNRFTGKEVEK